MTTTSKLQEEITRKIEERLGRQLFVSSFSILGSWGMKENIRKFVLEEISLAIEKTKEEILRRLEESKGTYVDAQDVVDNNRDADPEDNGKENICFDEAWSEIEKSNKVIDQAKKVVESV